MHAALRGVDVIYKGVHALVKRVVVLQRNLDIYAILRTFAVNNLRIQRHRAAVQIANELLNTTFVVECLLLLLAFSYIPQHDPQIFGQKCHLSQTIFQNRIVVDSLFENFLIRQERNRRSMQRRIAFANHLQRVLHMSPLIPLLIDLAFCCDLNFQPF